MELQELINTETTKIDSSPRLPDGTFRREVAVNLGKLPGQQGGLADRTQKLEEDLSALAEKDAEQYWIAKENLLKYYLSNEEIKERVRSEKLVAKLKEKMKVTEKVIT